jgi:hypothetical protein
MVRTAQLASFSVVKICSPWRLAAGAPKSVTRSPAAAGHPESNGRTANAHRRLWLARDGAVPSLSFLQYLTAESEAAVAEFRAQSAAAPPSG